MSDRPPEDRDHLIVDIRRDEVLRVQREDREEADDRGTIRDARNNRLGERRKPVSGLQDRLRDVFDEGAGFVLTIDVMIS
jgi:hypothetical protein